MVTIATNATASGFVHNLGENEFLYVPANVLVGSTNSASIYGALGNNRIILDGTTVGQTYGIFTRSDNYDGSTPFQTSIVVGQTGVAIGEFGGVLSSAHNTHLINHGQITGGYGAGIYDVGASVINFGTITGLGTASGSRYGVAIGSSDHAYSLDNYGTINYQGSSGIAIIGGSYGGNSDLRMINNFGSVISASGLAFAGAGSASTSGGAETLNNFGLMVGDVNMFAEDDILLNSGEIRGNVSMGRDFDYYDGREGTVTGHVDGGSGRDTLLGGHESDDLRGGNDDDIITGNGGDDTLRGDDGSDTLTGGLGSDILVGGNGDDMLRMIESEAGDFDYMTGGLGQDTADFKEFASAVWIDLDYAGGHVWTRDQNTLGSGTWRAIADIDLDVEIITGTGGLDLMRGSYNDNSFVYVESAPVQGIDRLDGRGGTDTVTFDQSATVQSVWVDLQYVGAAQAWTSDTRSSLTGAHRPLAVLSNIENIKGTIGIDVLRGDDADNTFIYVGSSVHKGIETINGRGGTDTADFSSANFAVWVNLSYSGTEAYTRDATNLSAGTWREIAKLYYIENLRGSPHDDALTGDAGANTFYASQGNDLMTGMGGADRFVFRDADVQTFRTTTITDFNSAATDRIDLSDVFDIIDFADLRDNHASNSAGGLNIHFAPGIRAGEHFIELTGYSMADFTNGNLTADDFIF